MQDVEVLAIMRRVLAATKTSCPSSLGGSMGREVDRFRTLCFREYLKSIEQCQSQGLNVSQATLQKGMGFFFFIEIAHTHTSRIQM